MGKIKTYLENKFDVYIDYVPAFGAAIFKEERGGTCDNDYMVMVIVLPFILITKHL